LYYFQALRSVAEFVKKGLTGEQIIHAEIAIKHAKAVMALVTSSVSYATTTT
jgi:hypothetical protein